MNKLKLSLISIATLVASNSNAQTFYQCMPCPAGTYASNGTCTPCPAGTYSQVTGATSSAVCTACPDYQWSNAGATKCGVIQIPVYYFYGDDNSYYKKKDLLAGETYTFSNDLFGGDPYNHKKKSVGFGQRVMTYKMEDNTMLLNCKKLPCDFPGGHNNRIQRILSDGTIQYNFNGDHGSGWNNGEKAIW